MMPGMMGGFFKRTGIFNGPLSFVGSATGIHSGASPGSVSLTGLTGGSGSAPQEGDIVVVAYNQGSTGDTNPSIIGYTELADLHSSDSFKTNLGVYYKIMGETPDTTFAPDGDPTPYSGSICIHVWRGVDVNNPIDVTTVTATGINSPRANPPAITPVTTGAVILAIGGSAMNTNETYLTPADLSNFIHRYYRLSPAFTPAECGIGSKAWTGGAFNPAQWQVTAANAITSWAAVTLALRPGPLA